jgi:hypothetical protein
MYLVLDDHGQFGIAYVETDPAEADHETIIRNFLTGQYSNALRVVAFNTAEGWSRDVSEDIAGEVLERAFDADENLGEDTKRFIDRHVTPGEKRPSAASVRRTPQPPSSSKDRRVSQKKPRCRRGFLEHEPAGGGGGGYEFRAHLIVRLLAPSKGSGERFHDL